MVVLPELNDDQRLYLKTIFDYFHNEGKWPTYLWVENAILQTHPEMVLIQKNGEGKLEEEDFQRKGQDHDQEPAHLHAGIQAGSSETSPVE